MFDNGFKLCPSLKAFAQIELLTTSGLLSWSEIVCCRVSFYLIEIQSSYFTAAVNYVKAVWVWHERRCVRCQDHCLWCLQDVLVHLFEQNTFYLYSCMVFEKTICGHISPDFTCQHKLMIYIHIFCSNPLVFFVWSYFDFTQTWYSLQSVSSMCCILHLSTNTMHTHLSKTQQRVGSIKVNIPE